MRFQAAFCILLFSFPFLAVLNYLLLFLFFSFLSSFCFLLLLPAFFKKYFSAVNLFSFFGRQWSLFILQPSTIIWIIQFLFFSSLLFPKIPDHNQTTIIYTCLAQQTIVYLIIIHLASLIFIVLYCVVQDEEGIVNRLFMHWVNNQGIKSEY